MEGDDAPRRLPLEPRGRLRQAIDAADVRLLSARRKRILMKLAMLSEARIMSYNVRPERVYVRDGSSAPPPDVDVHADVTETQDGPPLKDRSLYEHYVWRFRDAKGDYWRTEKLCAQAEHDYAMVARGNRTPHNEDGPMAERRILRDYAGVAPWEVATWEGCDPQYVRKLRRLNELDPQTGLPDVNLSDRDREIVRAVRSGEGQRSIAARLGLSQPRIAQVVAA